MNLDFAKPIPCSPDRVPPNSRVAVRIRYYHDDTLSLGTLIDNQIWKYDADKKTWYITTPLPSFK